MQTSDRLPDFIIGGAPKCGTTSLHFILGQNPEIGLPDEEIHYFDADDPIAHPDFLHVENRELQWYDPRLSEEANLAWYKSWFAPHAHLPFVGEDSTTYLFSEVAPERIKALLPDVKLIFMLRDPVARAYSQYWHAMRSARLACSFEQGLIDNTSMMLGSTYATHLRRYMDVFPSDQIQIVFFEEFVKDQQAQIDRVTDYIGAARMDMTKTESWFNKTYYPTHPRAHEMLNRLGKRFVANRYKNHMSRKSDSKTRQQSKWHYRYFKYVNPIFLKAEKPPKIQPSTRAYLEQHFSARNAGLSELLGRDLSALWPGFTG